MAELKPDILVVGLGAIGTLSASPSFLITPQVTALAGAYVVKASGMAIVIVVAES